MIKENRVASAPQQHATTLPPTQRRIWLFGALRLWDVRGQFYLYGDKIQNLFAYLALEPGGTVRRERLIDQLWPDAAWGQGNRLLSNTLYRLRRTLGEGWLTYSAKTIKLNAGADLWLDVAEVEKLYRLGTVRALQTAIELHTGELLPEVDGPWVLVHRQRLQQLRTEALRTLTAWAESTQQLDLALQYAQQLIQAEPFEEMGYHSLMRLYARQKRYVAALQQFEQVKALFAEELAAPPSEELTAFAEILRTEQQALLHQPLPHLLFVGRMAERQALLTQLAQLQRGEGGLVFIKGEPGIGKTALLHHLAQSVAWRGLPLLQATALQPTALQPTALQPTEHAPPVLPAYAPLATALSRYLATAQAAPLLNQIRHRLPLQTQRLLTGLLPMGGLPAEASVTESTPLTLALSDLLTMLAEQGPHVLIFDDVHQAPPGFWALLQTMADRQVWPQLLIVLALRSDDLPTASTAWSTLQWLEKRCFPLPLVLRGLDLPACDQLVQALGVTLEPGLLPQLHQLTAGNPLFLQQALRAHSGTATSAQQILMTMVADLPPFTLTALQVGAMLGAHFTPERWSTLLGEAVEAAATQLLSMQLLVATAQGYQITHKLVRKTLLALWPRPDYQRWQQRVAYLLQEEGVAPHVLAWHYEEAGLYAEAAHQQRLAAEQTRADFIFAQALHHYDQALALVNLLPEAGENQWPEVVAMRLGRQAVLRGLGRYADCAAELVTLVTAAELLQDERTQLLGLQAQLELYVVLSHGEQATRVFAQGLQLAQKLRQPPAEVDLRFWWAVLLAATNHQQGDALANVTAILHLVDEFGQVDELRMVDEACQQLLQARAFTAAALGYLQVHQPAQAKEYSLRAYHLLELHPQFRTVANETLAVVVQALWAVGDLAAAWHYAQHLHQLPKVQTDLFWSAHSYFYLIGLTTDMGEIDYAVALLGQWRNRLATFPQPILPGQLAGLAWVTELRLWVVSGHGTAGMALLQQPPPLLADTQGEHSPLTHTAWLLAAQLYLLQAHYTEAIAVCANALRVVTESSVQMAFHRWWAYAAAGSGDEKSAKQQLALAHNGLPQGNGPAKLLGHFLKFVIERSTADLAAARAELHRQAQQFSDPQRQQRFLHKVWLHHTIEQAWQAQQQSLAVPVRLARCTVPLGKQLTSADLVDVAWTPNAGVRDAEILQRQGKVALRRLRILRLFQEANQHGAAPTNQDLAQALQVTVRTIDSDMAQLAVAGLLTHVTRRLR